MNVAITGAGGLLGRYLLTTKPRFARTVALWHKNNADGHADADFRLDVTKKDQVLVTLKGLAPDVLVHCAGIGDVDAVEQEPARGWKINVEGTKYLADTCAELGIKMVYLSSNAIFEGTNPPYVETDATIPVNTYGYQKMCAETFVRELRDHLIVRPILLYGWSWEWGRGNWATRIYKALREGKTLRVVDDRMTQPTYTRDLAEAIWKMLDLNVSGTYHVAGEDRCTLYVFARQVARTFQLPITLILPAKSGDFPTIAPRPVDTTYGLEKIYRIGIQPGGIQWGLSQMRGENV
jgi:dTDP-4-dehydrorhamnose reductase